MKTLVIGDLHHKVKWVEKCIKEIKPDLTVFLGDYFDSFGDNPEITSETAKWLKESLETPKRVHLMGNHDMPYRFPMNFHLWCTGFTHEKALVINEIISRASWNKMMSFHWIDGWLLSHAGINHNFLHPLKGFDLGELRKFEQESLLKCNAESNNPLFGCGYSRGGNYRCGGITWQDFDVDFVPIENVNQIVGHTPHPKVAVKLLLEGDNDKEDAITCTWDEYLNVYKNETKKSLNLDIDTHRKHYAILENGKVQIMNNKFALENDFSQ